MLFPFLSTQQIFYLWQKSHKHKKIDKGTTSEVVEITSGESESEVRERQSTEAVAEEPRTEERGREQESPGDSIPKESGHEQRTSVAPEGGKDQYNSGSDDDD